VDNEVIMTYARSSVIEEVFITAARQGKKFRVIIVDSHPRFEGKKLLRQLLDEGIDCSYVLLHAISHVMPEVSKVFLGAHCFFSNGFLMSRVGTSMVAIIARQLNVPVLVGCETYKFTDRVQLDSFVFNELSDPEDLVSTNIHSSSTSEKNPLENWRDIPSLKLLNLAYDVTPAEYITAVITELGLIPGTSIAVVLRDHICYSTPKMGDV
jgi:translation initiation factor eIF-2B subunit delta